jgi:hypothetical protein
MSNKIQNKADELEKVLLNTHLVKASDSIKHKKVDSTKAVGADKLPAAVKHTPGASTESGNNQIWHKNTGCGEAAMAASGKSVNVMTDTGKRTSFPKKASISKFASAAPYLLGAGMFKSASLADSLNKSGASLLATALIAGR